MNSAMTVLDVPVRFFAAVFAEEGQEPQPKHVERCQECGEDAGCPKHPASVWTAESFEKDGILAEKAGKRRETGNCERRCGHSPEGDRDLGAQPSHLPHILLTADGVNNRSCGKEQ